MATTVLLALCMPAPQEPLGAAPVPSSPATCLVVDGTALAPEAGVLAEDRRPNTTPAPILVRVSVAAYCLGMDKSTGRIPDGTGEHDDGEVPDKQLHRWKGEGGAPPPEAGSETAFKSGTKAGPHSEAQPEANGA
jgi:hypothetical protein